MVTFLSNLHTKGVLVVEALSSRVAGHSLAEVERNSGRDNLADYIEVVERRLGYSERGNFVDCSPGYIAAASGSCSSFDSIAVPFYSSSTSMP